MATVDVARRMTGCLNESTFDEAEAARCEVKVNGQKIDFLSADVLKAALTGPRGSTVRLSFTTSDGRTCESILSCVCTCSDSRVWAEAHDDAVVHVTSWLSIPDVLRCSKVCRRWGALCSTKYVWEQIFLRNCNFVPTAEELEVCDFRAACRAGFFMKAAPVCDTFVWSHPDCQNKPASTKSELHAHGVANRRLLMRFELTQPEVFSAILHLYKLWDGWQPGGNSGNRTQYVMSLVDNNWTDEASWETAPQRVLGVPPVTVTVPTATNSLCALDITPLLREGLRKAQAQGRAPWSVSLDMEAVNPAASSSFASLEAEDPARRPLLVLRAWS